MQTYDRPTPETDAFMLHIDDSEIDLTQVEAKLKTLECQRDYARQLLGEVIATVNHAGDLASLTETTDSQHSLASRLLPTFDSMLQRIRAAVSPENA